MKAVSPLASQAGATLIVALVFLVVLTAAGITAVRFATNDERMASSNQFRNTAFQASQTEIRAQLLRFNVVANRQPLMSALEATAVTSPSSSPNGESNATIIARFPNLRELQTLTTRTATSAISQTPKLRSMGDLDCASFGQGYSFGNYTCRQYEVRNVAAIGTSGAFSDQTQGLVFFNLK